MSKQTKIQIEVNGSTSLEPIMEKKLGCTYINGKLVAENKNHKGDINYPNAKDAKDESDAELVIGQYRDKNEFFPHNGLIDEVKIYNRALSIDEINHNMKSSGLSVDLAHQLATYWAKIKN